MTRSLLLLSLVACTAQEGDGVDTGGAADGADGGGANEGQLSFRFAIDDVQAASMSEAPSGTFYGGVFSEEDVTPVGTVEGAVAWETFEVEVELSTDGSSTGPLYTSGPLPVGKLYMLGFLDSDANSPEDTAPDQGDPVTAPGFDDRFEVVGGEVVECDVMMDLLMP